MIYSINIENAQEESGKILFDRLLHLTSSVSKISEGALQIKLIGASKKRGRKSLNITKSLEIQLTGIKDESTALIVECEKFRDTLGPYQIGLFDSDFFDHTPISVLMSCYRTVLGVSDEPEVFIDKQLIDEMKKLSEAFVGEGERLVFKNEGTVDDLILTKSDVFNIHHIEDEIPQDQKLIVTGIVEELRYSRFRVKINTDDGLIHAYLSKSIDKGSIASYWGKNVALAGVMHYGPKGTKNFEIMRIYDDEDKSLSFFRELPKQLKLLDAPPPNPIKKWEGKWHDEESLEELLEDL
jgi:hypothetical protein